MAKARLQIRGEGGELLMERYLGAVKASRLIRLPIAQARGACGRTKMARLSLAEEGPGPKSF
jgi:hypothetical protein